MSSVSARLQQLSAEPRERRAVLLAWLARGEVNGAVDQLAAAEVLLASDVPAEVATAERLALAAMAKEPRAKPVAAAAFDRQRLLAGKPQKFGTQLVEKDGRRELWPVDATTTDSERAKWGLPALAELRRRAGE